MPIPPAFSAAIPDRYQIVRELGQSGMGIVYLARLSRLAPTN